MPLLHAMRSQRWRPRSCSSIHSPSKTCCYHPCTYAAQVLPGSSNTAAHAVVSAVCTCWDLLGAVMQAWEGQCGQLDQYGMKLTRLFANLCNAGVQPQQLTHSLAGGPCRSNLP